MKVKVCPKCGAESKEDRESCSNCYASLSAVEPTESTNQPIIVGSRPGRAPRPPKSESQPSGPAEPTHPQGSNLEGMGIESSGRSPFYYREPPAVVSRRSNVGLLVFVLILLAGVGFAGWWFFLKQPSPAQVVQGFINACEAQDAEKAKSFLCKSTLNIPGVAEGFTKGFAAARKLGKDNHSSTSTGRIKLLSTSYTGTDKSTAIVASQSMDEKGEPIQPELTFDWVLIKEDGAWKIDLVTTVQKMFVKALGEAMKKAPKPPSNVPGGSVGR